MRSNRTRYFAGNTLPKETRFRTTMRNAASSEVGGWVNSCNAVCIVVNRNSDSATLNTVRQSRRLLRSALRRMNPGIVKSAAHFH